MTVKFAELITSKCRIEFSGPCGCLILVCPWIFLASWQPLAGHAAAVLPWPEPDRRCSEAAVQVSLPAGVPPDGTFSSIGPDRQHTSARQRKDHINLPVHVNFQEVKLTTWLHNTPKLPAPRTFLRVSTSTAVEMVTHPSLSAGGKKRLTEHVRLSSLPPSAPAAARPS